MIDIHCHILPGIDDGSPDLETSVQMAQIAAKDGIRVIIATPHIGDDPVDRKVVLEKVKILNVRLKEKNVQLRVFPGGEIQSQVALKLAATHPLGFSRSILLEFPHTFLPDDSRNLVRTLVAKGHRVIVAHAERNDGVAQDPEKAGGLVQAGARIQVTAESITGFLGPDPKRCADYLIRKGWIHFIATDSHSPSFRRPALSSAVQVVSKVLGHKQAKQLVLENPMKIIQASRRKR